MRHAALFYMSGFAYPFISHLLSRNAYLQMRQMALEAWILKRYTTGE